MSATKSRITKPCKWNAGDGNTLEISKGYPVADLISVMRFSLTKSELLHLIGEFTELSAQLKDDAAE